MTEGSIIDLFIILKGSITFTVKRKGYVSVISNEPVEAETYSIHENEFICCDNIWKYIPKYDKNASITHLHFRPENNEIEILTMKNSEYKSIIKKTHQERDIVKFICKFKIFTKFYFVL